LIRGGFGATGHCFLLLNRDARFRRQKFRPKIEEIGKIATTIKPLVSPLSRGVEAQPSR
jgi:hypothetical protein